MAGYEFGLSFPIKVKRRDGRLKLEFSKDERLLIQDVLDFWMMRGGMVQFTIGRPVKPPDHRLEISAEPLQWSLPADRHGYGTALSTR